MTMVNQREQAWVIFVNEKITEVYVTTGTDDVQAKQQATGKVKAIQKEHSAGAVRFEGPFPVIRK